MNVPHQTKYALVLLIIGLLVLPGCQTIRELTNIRNVDFSLGQLTDIRVAGVNLDGVRSYSDLSAGDILKLTAGFAKKELPLSVNVHIKALNPADNQVDAQLTRLDWTLFLEEKETISGALDQSYQLKPGIPQEIPVAISLELTDFFDSNIRELINLASTLSGQGGSSTNVKLVATPIIDTLIGPIRYPEPITIVSENVGG